MSKLELPARVMIIRHGEKPGVYGDKGELYSGIDEVGNRDEESLVTLGWERAGGLASLVDPLSPLQPSAASVLRSPTVIYASDPIDKKEPSQRPFQTISALAAKLAITPNIKFKGKEFKNMVTDVLTKNTSGDTVLISWQHEDILPKKKGDDSIVHEIIKQTGSDSGNMPQLPTQPWPGDRYDMVLVFDKVEGGKYTRFTQCPQMLLAGDQSTLFK